MLNTRPVPAIVQQVQQEQTAEWEAIVNEIAKIDVQETQGALRMGDLFLKIEEEYGPKHMQTAAEQAGVTWNVARQRHWVSKKIPASSPIRKMKSLSFTHLRTLANTENPEEWAQRVEEEQLKTKDLIEQIAQAGDQKSVDKGIANCAHCSAEIQPNSEYIAVVVGGKRSLLCDLEHGILFLESARKNAGSPAPVDPFKNILAGDSADDEELDLETAPALTDLTDAPDEDPWKAF